MSAMRADRVVAENQAALDMHGPMPSGTLVGAMERDPRASGGLPGGGGAGPRTAGR
jgi:hypothetical protein